MRSRNTSILIALALTFTLPAFLVDSGEGSSSPPPNVVSTGLVKLDGGTECVTFSQGAIPENDGTDIVGTVFNQTGEPIDDLTIKVIRKGTMGTGPTAGQGTDDVTLTQLNTYQSANATNVTSGSGNSTTQLGFRATLTFGSSGGIQPIPPNNTVDVAIDLHTLGTASKVEVCFTPSFKDKPKGSAQHADLMEAFAFKGDLGASTHSMLSMGHDRIVARIQNGDGTRPLTAISGTIGFSEAGNTVSQVFLQDPASGFTAPANVQYEITGAKTFTVTNFTPLIPGGAYELIVVFATVPDTASGPLDLSLSATFDDE